MDSKYNNMIKKIKESDFLGDADDFREVCKSVNSHKKYEGTEVNTNIVPFLSVVIPTYKRPILLKETLESIIFQDDFDDYEILIVDNEGTASKNGISDTEKLITLINNPRIRYYQNEKNIPSGENWNMCLALARGEWICIVHDDDVLLPNCLQTLYTRVKSNPDIEFLGCLNHSFQKIEELKDLQYEKKSIISNIKYEEFMYGMPVSLLGAFFKREKAIEIGGFDTISYMQDYTFVAKFAYYYKVYLCHEPLYGYRISLIQDSANNEMNYVRRVADYYLWKSIAKRRTGLFQKVYLKNCQYNLKNRIKEYNSDKKYGETHYINLDDILDDCDIDKRKLHEWEYVFCKGLHFINMIRSRNAR